jgi:hypothetical protein
VNYLPIILGLGLFAVVSRKKTKKPTIETPKIQKFGRVERLLNLAAIKNALSASKDRPFKPQVIFGYVNETPALEIITKHMYAQAEAFQNVDFYQFPMGIARKIIHSETKPLPGIAGALGAGYRPQIVHAAFIYPEDSEELIAQKISQSILFATTGQLSEK